MIANQKGTALLGGAASDEAIESSSSVLATGSYGQGIKGLQQFYSPPEAARLVHEVIGDGISVLDPTAGDGSLLKEFNPTRSFGVEIDHDQIRASEGGYNPLKGDFQHFYTLLKLGMSPWPAIVANPPFGLQWSDPTLRDGKPTNSTVLTLMMVNRLLAEDGQFAFICGASRYERQLTQLPDHSTIYAVIQCDDMFEGTREPTVILFGIHDALRSPARPGVIDRRTVTRDMLDLCGSWVIAQRNEAMDTYARLAVNEYAAYTRPEQFKAIQDEYNRRLEKRIKTREFDAQLFNGDHIQWLPSGFAKMSLQQAGLLNDFHGLNGQHVAYFAQNERLWFKLSGAEERQLITVDPKLRQAVANILGDIQRIRIPLYELKPQQRLGFLDDIDSLRCKKDDPERKFRAGEVYRLDTQTKGIVEKEERVVESKKEPGKYDLKTFEKHKKVMQLTITGQGAHYSIQDGGDLASQNIQWLIDHFEIPEAPPVEKRHPEEIAALEKLVREVLEDFEKNSAEWEKTNTVTIPFKARDFQVADIARMLFKGFGLLAWEQGLGKTVGGLAFYAAAVRLGAKKKLIITTAGDLKPQWIREIKRFLNETPEVILTHGQAKRIAKKLRRGGTGIYLAHYEALAVNGTLRRNSLLPVVTVREWTEERLVRGTDRYGYWYWHRESDNLSLGPDSEELAELELPEGCDATAQRASRETVAAMQELGFVQVSCRNYYIGGTSDTPRAAYGYVWPRMEKITKRLTSKDICPECESDTRNGWNGAFCEAEDAFGQKCNYSHFAVKMKPIASLLSTAFHDGVALLDEITYIQGNDSKRSKAMRGIQARYRLGLTGTPIKNYVDQIFWPLAWCLGYSKPWFPYDYDGGRTRFENDFCVVEYATNGRRKETRKVLPDVTNLSRFWRMLASCTIRRRMEETGEDLVDVYYHEINVPLSVGQAEQTREWLKKMPHGFPALFAEKYPDSKVVQAGMQDILAPLIGLNWKLDYAMTVPEADPDFEWTGIDIDNWTPANLRALELTMALVKQGRKVLVGSHIVAAGQWLAERLQEKGVAAVHIVDDSGTTVEAKKRAQRVYTFQTDENVQVFCAGMKAIRLGHNLDAANAMVLNGLDFDYETLDQFVKRIRRLTSQMDIDVYVILPTLSGQQTITSRKWQLLNQKGNAADLALDGRLVTKNEQEISEGEMIRELQERGMTVTDDAVESVDIEEAWMATPMLEDFSVNGHIPPRATKEEEPEEDEKEPTEDGDQLTLAAIPDTVPDELVEEQNGVEMPEVDPIDLAEAELAALEADAITTEDEEDSLEATDTKSSDSFPPPFAGDSETVNAIHDELAPGAADATPTQNGASANRKDAETEATDDGHTEQAGMALEVEGPAVAVEEPQTEPEDTSTEAAPDVTSPAPSLDYMGQLKQAKELLDLEVLTQDEFDSLKAELLDGLRRAA